MVKNRKNKKEKKASKSIGLDDLNSLKNESAMKLFLSKNKGIVLTVVIIFLTLIFTIVTNFLMLFKII